MSVDVTGRCGDMLGVWIEPVTAHVMMTLPCAAAISSSKETNRDGPYFSQLQLILK
jgi:hypothetical protein